MELKSLTQRIKCVKLESWSLRMLSECLDNSSMCLGVPFIAPRQLEAVGDQHGRLSLPSVEWHTGQSGAPPDRSCRRSRCLICFQIWHIRPLLPWADWRTGHCPVHQPTVGAVHVSHEDCAADRWRRRPLAHRTVR
jgi:hypothetical protein